MPLNLSTLLDPNLIDLPKPSGDFSFNTATSAELSDDEARVASWLAAKLFDQRGALLLSGLYYEGLQAVTSLGIMIPPELEGLRAILGWAGTGVEAVDERLALHGFRMPNSTAVDEDLADIWQANNMDEESPLGHLDAMIFGNTQVVVGPRAGGGQPVITIESPLDMYTVWDPRARRARSSLQTYIDTDPTSEHYGRQRAAFYLLGSTIHMVRGERGWMVIDRDDHKLTDERGELVLPVVPLPNRERVGDRLGRSEITPAWRNTIDRSCRNMAGMEVAREFFGAPPRYLLGVAKGAFEGMDGTARSAWETYIGRILALEADEHGNLPVVGTFASGNPEAFTKLYDVDVRIMAGLTGLPPQYLGIYSDGNPASADAIRMSDFRLNTKAARKATVFGSRWALVMRLALLIRDGQVPDDAHRMEVDWAPTGIPTPAADTDAVTKQIAQGMLPAESDVALEKVGYSAVERERIAIDRRRMQGRADRAAVIAAARNRAQPAAPVRTDEPVPAEQTPTG
ncbi:phage portal protein [Nocardia puris]|uniref:phage portal protein n=1 Tax=Nocardia puris TaxID=208602 RepID=UPI0018948A5D|nr:phage portal protein [Nocardia puris]MBF6459812.1 phage portal protein [Nocardia puris]